MSVVEVSLVVERGRSVSHTDGTMSVLACGYRSLVHLIVIVQHRIGLVSLPISVLLLIDVGLLHILFMGSILLIQISNIDIIGLVMTSLHRRIKFSRLVHLSR